MADICLPPRHVLSDTHTLSADIAGDATSEFVQVKHETRRAPCAPRQICRSDEVVQVTAWVKSADKPGQCVWREVTLHEEIMTGNCQWRGAWMASTAYRQCPDYSLTSFDSDGDGKFELLVKARWNGHLMSGYPVIVIRNQIEGKMRERK